MKKQALTRRGFLRLSAGATAGAILASCAPAAFPTPTTGEKPSEEKAVEVVEIRTMYHQMWPEWRAHARKVFDAFEQEHPNIKVRDEWVPEAWDKIQTEYAAGGGPDVIINQMDWVIPGAARGMFVDLRPYIARDNIDMDAYWYDHSLEWEWQGGLYALLLYAGGQALYVNTDLLDKAGLSFPEDDWTWDDLLEYGKKLTNADENQWGILGANANPPYWSSSFIHGAGGSVLNEARTECTLDQPEAREALQWLADLIFVHKVMPSPAVIAGLDNPFLTGKVGLYFGGTWMESEVRKAEFNWDFARMPVHPTTGIRSVQLGSNGWSILSTSKHPDEAWELVKYLGTEPGQKAFMGQGLPGLRSVIESPEYIEAHAPQHVLRLIEDFSCCGHNYYPTPDAGEWWSAVTNELDVIWSGEATVEEATANACKAVNEIFAKRPPEWGM